MDGTQADVTKERMRVVSHHVARIEGCSLGKHEIMVYPDVERAYGHRVQHRLTVPNSSTISAWLNTLFERDMREQTQAPRSLHNSPGYQEVVAVSFLD